MDTKAEHVLSVIRNRQSLRIFDTKAICEEEENALIEAAMRAPTAGNQMLYSMIIIRDQAKKERLAQLCDHQPFMAKAPLMIVFVADFQKWMDYYVRNDVKQFCEGKAFQFEAPQESDLMLATADALIAAQNSVIAAEAMGIGSCYIGDIVEHGEQIKELLNLPQYTMPVALLVYGHYPKDLPRVKRSRYDRRFVVFEDAYQRLDGEQIDAMFAQEDQKFNPQNSVGAENFAQQFYARKTGAPFSKEMARSVRFWLKQWDGRLL